MNIETVEFGGWQHNLKLSNDACEMIITLEVGPRVLSFATRENGRIGENVFCVFSDGAGGKGESQWQSRGGHRLWLAPENESAHPFTYFPDNAPVEHEIISENRVRFTPPMEPGGAQKETQIELDENTARAIVTHRVTNAGSEALAPLAPWALSVMAPGGIAIVPFAPLGEHPRDLLPDRKLVLWPYADLRDERLYLGCEFLTLAQDSRKTPIKIGLGHAISWAGYWNRGTLFLKKWRFDTDANYPDLGSTCELFTNSEMLEVESLAPLVSLAPGQSAEHVEEWNLFPNVPAFGARDEVSIRAALKGLDL